MRHGGTHGFEAAIEARLHGRKRCAEHHSNFVELHFFLKAQQQDFAIDRGKLAEIFVDAGALLARDHFLKRRGAAFVAHVEWSVVVRAVKFVEALRFFAAVPVEHKIARDGEKPSFKFPLAVVLMAAFEDANPGFLEKIFGALAVRGEVQQVAEEPELILLDQSVEHVRVALLEAASECFGVIGHE